VRGKRTDLSMAQCAIARSLEVVGDWWSLLIVREAFRGRERFGEFQKSLGLAKNILATRLKKLVDAQIFSIEADANSTQSHRYVLTPKGESLHPVLVALWQWGEENCFERDELELVMVDKVKGKPLVKMQPTSQDGRDLGPRDIRLLPRSAAASSHAIPESSVRRKIAATRS
jgi:DNA-binding HxlR family transcriptional regulator